MTFEEGKGAEREAETKALNIIPDHLVSGPELFIRGFEDIIEGVLLIVIYLQLFDYPKINKKHLQMLQHSMSREDVRRVFSENQWSRFQQALHIWYIFQTVFFFHIASIYNLFFSIIY